MKSARVYPWFNLDAYAPRRSFDLRAWANMVLVRDRFLDDAARDKQSGYNAANFDGYWAAYLDEALPCNYSKDKTDLHTSIPVLEDITHLLRPGKGGRLSIAPFAIDTIPVRVLQLNILAPDAILIDQVNRWLADVRKKNPLPIPRRGRPSLNAKITDQTLRSWSNYNILAVLDLDLYDKAKGRKRLTAQNCLKS